MRWETRREAEREVEPGMGRETSERDSAALQRAFAEIVDDSAAPSLPSVTDAAVAGGRRIRRRRAVASAGSALAVAALAVTVAVGLTGPGGSEGRPGPAAPPSDPPPSATPTPPSEVAPSEIPTPARNGEHSGAPGVPSAESAPPSPGFR